MEFVVKLESNLEVETSFYLPFPSWENLKDELNNHFREPVPNYTIKYFDDENDAVTLTSQNEFEEMIRNGAKELLISSPFRINFLPPHEIKSTQNNSIQKPVDSSTSSTPSPNIHLAGLNFFTWFKHDTLGWIKLFNLTFNNYEQASLNNVFLNASAPQKEVIDGFSGVSISWNPNQNVTNYGYCLFFHSSQLKGKSNTHACRIYWPEFP